MKDATPLMVGSGVNGVASPSGCVVIYMQNEQAFARQRGIPMSFLPVFEDIIFIRSVVVINKKSRSIFTKRKEAFNKSVCSQHNGGEPARFYLFVSGVSSGRISLVIIAAIVHKIPRVHAERPIARCVVHVGKS